MCFSRVRAPQGLPKPFGHSADRTWQVRALEKVCCDLVTGAKAKEKQKMSLSSGSEIIR